MGKGVVFVSAIQCFGSIFNIELPSVADVSTVMTQISEHAGTNPL